MCIRDRIKADLICLADEVFDPEETMIIFDPTDTWKKTKVLGGTYELRELLIPVIREGKRVYTSPEVMDLRAYCQKEQNTCLLYTSHPGTPSSSLP